MRARALTRMVPARLSEAPRCVRDARPEGRDGGGALRRTVVEDDVWRAAAGPARLGTAVSCPTARAARPGALAEGHAQPKPFAVSDRRPSRAGVVQRRE